MAKVRPDFLSEVDEAFGRYEEEVRAAGLEASTERTYLLHSRNFIRWLHDDFEPGARTRRGTS